jgi:hypothetical protein
LSCSCGCNHNDTSINEDKHSRNNCHSNYWRNRHDCHSDYWGNRKYHRVIHSYSSINGDKYCRNNAVVSVVLVTVDWDVAVVLSVAPKV